MLPFLDKDTVFPPTSKALSEPNGLLAAGADLSTERLLLAYSQGIFPWYSEDEPILWWSPNPRTVFNVREFTPAKSLIRYMNKSNFIITVNCAFEQTIEQCAAPRLNQSGTWITQEIKEAYIKLHKLQSAHSIEVWQDEEQVGGIYGVSIGKLFCGESMFSRVTNGSKIALSCLISHLREYQFPLVDCQVENSHLMSLGAVNISRDEYLQVVKDSINQPVDKSIWNKSKLDIHRLIKRHKTTGLKS